MRYFPLLLANLRRKRVRTALTIASFAVALFLFGLLTTIDNAFYAGVDVAGVDRLVIRNKISLIMPMPISYYERLKQIEGVELISYATWFGGIYQDPKNFFPQMAIEPETWRNMYPEYLVPEDQWQEFLKDRQGCIVGKQTADKYGWKIGDKIPLLAPVYHGGETWEFNLHGLYVGKRKSDDQTQFWFHFTYLDERTPYDKGFVGWYMVKVDRADRADVVAKAIDARFENSPFETTSETEQAFAAGFVKQFGNIKLILLSVGSVVFFTLLLITGSNMSLSVRERIGEFAVLKTIGFSDARILIMVLLESVFYSLIGGLIGLGLSKLFTMSGDPTGGLLPVFYLSLPKMLLGAAIATTIGLAAGLIPALIAGRLNIVNALRRV
ncbi:FtsX-like permease family protein [bacterium]|nr:FtsX-like permease family protein [bacterium]